MGSSVKKVVKKATTLPRKIIKTVKKNPALLMLAAPYAFPAAFGGITAASSGAFLQGAAKRALIQALATKAVGGDVSIKDSLIGGAVGQGIGQFAGNAAMFKNVDPRLLQAGIGATTNVGTSLATGQKIDPRSALISGGLNYLTTPAASQPSPNAMGGNIPEEIQDMSGFEKELADEQAGSVTSITGGGDPARSVIYGVDESVDINTTPTTASQIPGVSYTDNKIDFLQTGSYKKIVKDLFQGNIADAADLTYRIATDNPFETITALSAAAPLFFSPVPQEGESEEDFTQRKVDVTNYLRQYGSNFYSGADLDDFISRATSNFGYSQGGRVEAMGGGIMGLGKMPMGTPRMNQGGVTELDYRAEGGFVPVGIKEKADDVPAMLSKNEFVMTADAVRSAGDGSIEKGAQKMYDTMKQLESRVV